MTRFEPISLEFSGRIVPKARRSGYLLFVYAPRCSLLAARCSLLVARSRRVNLVALVLQRVLLPARGAGRHRSCAMSLLGGRQCKPLAKSSRLHLVD